MKLGRGVRITPDLLPVVCAAFPKRERAVLAAMIQCVFGTFEEALQSGGAVRLRGFGQFTVRYQAPRMGRDPRTGTPMRLSGQYLAHFKPGPALRGIARDGAEEEVCV